MPPPVRLSRYATALGCACHVVVCIAARVCLCEHADEAEGQPAPPVGVRTRVGVVVGLLV